MASNKRAWQLTDRDVEILRTLEQLPLTPSLLLRWSGRFETPFPNIDVVHRRLAILRKTAGLVHRWPLAIASDGRPEHYYKLTLKGYRVLHEEPALTTPTSRAFSPIGEARHRHCLGLAQFLVHLGIAAKQSAIPFKFLGENRHRVTVGDKSLLTDAFIRFGSSLDNRSFMVEIDNSTESILSPTDTDSIERKLRLIEQEQSQYEGNDGRRSITLFVTLRSRERAANILDAARQLARNPRRRNFYAVYLHELLACPDPLHNPCFHDHNEEPVALLPHIAHQPTSLDLAQVIGQPALC